MCIVEIVKYASLFDVLTPQTGQNKPKRIFHQQTVFETSKLAPRLILGWRIHP